MLKLQKYVKPILPVLTFKLKSQLSARIAAEEAEQKRRIDAEEEKAVLTVHLEAARGAQSASAGVADGSDLDTYRVHTRITLADLAEDS